MAETPRLAFEMPVCVCVGGGSDVSVYVRVCEFRFVGASLVLLSSPLQGGVHASFSLGTPGWGRSWPVALLLAGLWEASF